MIKNWGAALALLSLIAIIGIGAVFSDQPHKNINNTAAISAYNQGSIDNYLSASFINVAVWAKDNREAIDALSAIGSVLFSAALAIFTLVLALRTSGLFTETAAIRKGSDEQRKDMLRSIAATESFAKAADTQNAIIAAQTDIIKKQHAVSRLQFLTTHRPRLRIRHIAIVSPSDIAGLQTLLFHDGGEIKGGLVVVNVGGSEATITHTRYRIFFSRTGLPPMPPYEFQFKTNLLKDGTVLAVGDSCSTEIFDKIVMDRSNQGEGIALREFDKGEWKIYVMGRITYRDDADRERFVFFCRERQDNGRFIPVKDDDYENED